MQKKVIKKSCNGCKASEFHDKCSLGYSCYEYIPKEYCPKPITNQQFITLFDKQ